MPRAAIHPGKHLAEELKEPGLTAADAARQLGVPVNRIAGILNGRRGGSDIALRFRHWFGTSADSWLNLQMLYELRQARAVAGARVLKLSTPAESR